MLNARQLVLKACRLAGGKGVRVVSSGLAKVLEELYGLNLKEVDEMIYQMEVSGIIESTYRKRVGRVVWLAGLRESRLAADARRLKKKLLDE